MLYPLFAKPVAGKYSLSVMSADGLDSYTDEVLLVDGGRRKVTDIAASLVGGAGYLIQRRLASPPELSTLFGPRLWSARLLVLVTPTGPVIHRAGAKVATGENPADNFWRQGNRLAAIDLASACITRVVHGTGIDTVADAPHPDTGQLIHGTTIPYWQEIVGLVTKPVRAWVRLESGRRLNLLEPDPDGWTDNDLAIGLSRTYCWGGHSRWELPLSAAQHCLLVLVLRQMLQPLQPISRAEALRELLHDADEGLMSYDPISPIKPHLGPEFTALAGRMQAAVQSRYNVLAWDAEAYTVHKQADRLAAASEAIHGAGWSLAELRETLEIDIPPLSDDPLSLPSGLKPWEPWPARTAAAVFLAKLHDLISPKDEGEFRASDVTAAVDRERTIISLSRAFARLPFRERARCRGTLEGSSLTDTLVFVETGDHSGSIEGVVVGGERSRIAARSG